MKKKSVLKLHHNLWFGKYKGEYLKDVIDKDPEYVQWLSTLENFSLHLDTRKYLDEKFYDDEMEFELENGTL